MSQNDSVFSRSLETLLEELREERGTKLITTDEISALKSTLRSVIRAREEKFGKGAPEVEVKKGQIKLAFALV